MSEEHHEIVIIKRHHGDHDDHHGGVWKIAFADFMTAMMAFFLVMWLIAANDKTRSTVARYFNPVKLVDATVRKPGLLDPKAEDDTAPGGRFSVEANGLTKKPVTANQPSKPPHETSQARQTRLDDQMRSNPLVALAEIAGKAVAADGTPQDALNGTAPAIGRKGGPSFRDPFAPPPPQSLETPDPEDDLANIAPPRPKPPVVDPASASKADSKSDSRTDSKSTQASQSAAMEKKDQDLTKQLMASLATDGHEGAGPDIKVRRTNEGFLVSLTDTGEFSMFANASAVPSRRVVLMMEHIAKVLKGKPGGVVIRGFTDNKPFRAGHYDNWNLSVDRAQAAHYMLVRGGLDDARIAGVEGFADHGGSPGLDPSSPLNRRIEILLKDASK